MQKVTCDDPCSKQWQQNHTNTTIIQIEYVHVACSFMFLHTSIDGRNLPEQSWNSSPNNRKQETTFPSPLQTYFSVKKNAFPVPGSPGMPRHPSSVATLPASSSPAHLYPPPRRVSPWFWCSSPSRRRSRCCSSPRNSPRLGLRCRSWRSCCCHSRHWRAAASTWNSCEICCWSNFGGEMGDPEVTMVFNTKTV